jgi:Cu-Zn family superoxide dismutase
MNRIETFAVLPATLMLAACGAMMPGGMGGPTAGATLAPASGSAAAGKVRFEQRGDHLMVMGRVTGLKPGQEHGFHVHDKGDCSSPDAMSAGGHFNPLAKPHGHHAGAERHAGDLPNLRADASGAADVHLRVTGLAVGSGPTDVVGRGLVVHAGPDDYGSQPAGNSGARIACGVIAAS